MATGPSKHSEEIGMWF